jgi:hypothetical protein
LIVVVAILPHTRGKSEKTFATNGNTHSATATQRSEGFVRTTLVEVVDGMRASTAESKNLQATRSALVTDR